MNSFYSISVVKNVEIHRKPDVSTWDAVKSKVEVKIHRKPDVSTWMQ